MCVCVCGISGAVPGVSEDFSTISRDSGVGERRGRGQTPLYFRGCSGGGWARHHSSPQEGVPRVSVSGVSVPGVSVPARVPTGGCPHWCPLWCLPWCPWFWVQILVGNCAVVSMVVSDRGAQTWCLIRGALRGAHSGVHCGVCCGVHAPGSNF